MFSCPPCASKALPQEFRNSAEALFPPEGFKEGKGPTVESVKAFANNLGIGENYKQLWDVYKSGTATGIEPTKACGPKAGTGEFLEHFQNNLDLLIQKTWVEKAEEIRKENLLDKVPPFIAHIENGSYSAALIEFGDILEELAYLFFGAQCQKNDFTEYVLRIDPVFGLFWWYGGQISGDQGWIKNADRDMLYALLLLGICYLVDL